MKLHAALAAAALLCAGLAAAQTRTPPVGDYIYQDGSGTLSVKAGNHFEINTSATNGHVCVINGTIAQGKAQLEDSPCVVTFTAGAANEIVVGTNGADACHDDCGAGTAFDGTYVLPAPACRTRAVAATRQAFKRQYDAKDYAAAQATLAPVLTDCDSTLDWIDKGWIRNDLALAQLRQGDRAACLKTLQPLLEDAGRTDAAAREDYPPADATRYLSMVHATRTNLKLCRG